MTARGLSWVALIAALGCVPAADAQDACQTRSVHSYATQFHGKDRAGAYEGSDSLAARAIAEQGMQLQWASESFDTLEVDGVIYPPLVYASPLFVPEQAIARDNFEGTTDVIDTATTNGWVYAVGADPCAEPGQILWRARISNAVPIDTLDQDTPSSRTWRGTNTSRCTTLARRS